MKTKIIAICFVLIGLMTTKVAISYYGIDQCANFIAQENTPKEIDSLAKGIIIYDKNSGVYRTLQIGDALSTTIVSPKERSDFIMVQPPMLSYDGTQILSIYRNSTKQTLFILNHIEAESTDKEIFVDKLEGYINPLTGFNTNTITAAIMDEKNQSYRYEKISVTSGDVETVEIKVDDHLSTPAQASISPDASRLAYVRYSTANAPQLVDELMIRDNGVGVAIKSLSASTIDSIHNIRWSPLSNYVLVTVTEGKSNQFKLFDKNAQPIASIPIQQDLGVQWSPDEKYVLYYDLPSVSVTHPRIWDVQSGLVVDPCVSGEGFWSPNSRYIGFIKYANLEEGSLKKISNIFVYDVLEHKAYKLNAANLESIGSVLGWGIVPIVQ